MSVGPKNPRDYHSPPRLAEKDVNMQPSPDIKIRSGPWDIVEIQDFLGCATIPMRLATRGAEWPLVQSLWFLFEGSALWFCTQRDSVVAQRLESNPRCAFEIAGDNPPYRGVRGRGVAVLDAGPAAKLLERLLNHYQIDPESSLASWLQSRLDNEVAIRIDNLVLSSWDYSSRMSR